MGAPAPACTPHGCPHCRCMWDVTDDPGRVNRDAPFYPLVLLVDSLTGNLVEMGAGRGTRYRRSEGGP